jgi:hypothetical protein
LDGLEEALRVLHESDEHADGDRSGERAQAAIPEDGDNRDDAEELDRWKEEREGQDGVLVGLHVQAVEVGELLARFFLVAEELHDAHAADVFLQEGVDARDGRADAAIGVADFVAEKPGGYEDERHDGEGCQREPPVHSQHDDDEDHQ